jgi:hypothetical protein
MALRTVTRVAISSPSTVVSFVEGALDVTTYVVEGTLIAQDDNSVLPFNTETNVSSKTVTGFTVSTDTAAWFTAVISSYGAADVDSSLQSNAIVTLSEVKTFLNIEASDTSQDAFLRTLINQTSDALEAFTNSKIALQDVSEVVSGIGECQMTMNSRPVYRIGIDAPMGAPLASDGFSTAATDGLGHSQSEWVGTGGDALTWVVPSQAFTRSGGTALSTISGNALEYVEADESDVIAQAELTIAENKKLGLVLRYTDSSNYILSYHNGTSVKLDKVVAGTTTNLLSETTTYVAGAILKVVCDGVKFRVYYNGTVVGSEVFIHNLATATKFGIYAEAQGGTNSIDDFAVFSLLDSIQERLLPDNAFEPMVGTYKNIIWNSYPRKSFYLELLSDCFTDGDNNILLHYKAGYSPIPEIFTEIALERIAAEFYKSAKSGQNILLKGNTSFNQTGGSISGGPSNFDQISGLSQTHRNMLQAAGYIFYDSPMLELVR